MAARALPTMPTWTANQEITSTLLNQVTTYTQFWANRPCFRMYQNTVQSVPNLTLTQITNDTEEWDSDNGRSSATPWSYVIPYAGRWKFTVLNAWNANATGIRASVLYQNGSQAPGGYVAIPASPASFATCVGLTLTIPCNALDTIAAYGEQGSGGALSTFSSADIFSFFEGELTSLGSP